jgi:hypothetical protein
MFYRRTATPTATDTNQYQPSLVPASNGHTPTVIGRTQTMFSPAKAITTAALVFGIGGVMLIAQPFGQEGDTPPGAATDVERAAPVEVSGRIICGSPARAPTAAATVVPLPDGEMTVTQSRDGAWLESDAQMSDPRLEGDYFISENRDEYQPPGESASIHVGSLTRRIVNGEGAWQGSGTFGALSDGNITAFSTVLVGERAYEGLSVIWEERAPDGSKCGVDVRGIISTAPFPRPQSPTATSRWLGHQSPSRVAG